MNALHDLYSQLPGLRDDRPTALSFAVLGGTGAASLATLEAAQGQLAGDMFGESFTVRSSYGSDGTRMLHFAADGLPASFAGSLELAPGLSAQVGPMDLSEANAEGPGASLWLACQGRPGMRRQGLPKAPDRWLALVSKAAGGPQAETKGPSLPNAFEPRQAMVDAARAGAASRAWTGGKSEMTSQASPTPPASQERAMANAIRFRAEREALRGGPK